MDLDTRVKILRNDSFSANLTNKLKDVEKVNSNVASDAAEILRALLKLYDYSREGIEGLIKKQLTYPIDPKEEMFKGFQTFVSLRFLEERNYVEFKDGMYKLTEKAENTFIQTLE
ncbi:hypothetical protein J4474_04265 [Candidatus Pacearchaeota archaeon]|nr:hypothetical protein [Candidatus Pacearchaeota archaeon]